MKIRPLPPSSPIDLCRLIGQTRTEIVLGIERAMQRNGIDLNFSQFLALKRIGEPGPVAPGELARALLYNPGAMTRLLDKLEQRGYLRRMPDPSDRRALRLELTAAGKSMRARVIKCSNAAAESTFDGVSERDKDKLRDVLSHVLKHLDAATRTARSD